jgi:WD40 repeat protein
MADSRFVTYVWMRVEGRRKPAADCRKPIADPGDGIMPLLRTPCGDAEETLSVAHEGEVLCCAFATGQSLGLSGGWDGRVILWDPLSGSPLATWKAGDKPVTACAWSPDGKRIFTGAMNGLLGEWDAVTRGRKSMFLAHTRPISGINFSPDGKTLATSSWDGTINLWKVGPEREWRTLAGHKDIVAGCRFLPDNKHLFSWSHDGTLKLWDLARAKQVVSWQAHGDRINAGDVSPDGKWFASSARDGNVSLWDANTRKEEARYTHQRGEMPWCGFTPDAQTLICLTTKGEVVFRAVPDLQSRPRETTGHSVQAAALSPTGDFLALGTTKGRVHFLPQPKNADLPLCVTATESQISRPTFFEKLMGKQHLIRVLRCACPICHQSFELDTLDRHTAVCPECKRRLHVNSFTLPAEALA